MNRHLVFVSWKRSIEAILLILTIEFFNNSKIIFHKKQNRVFEK
ncbi:hypothetical protein LEP1GSC021_0406 [Leptospira noguchii str. 1993005606]|nr:hypothetical protein LEP1GSC021_0406 [Leptospira noguchii str. 1993005606]